MDIFQTRRIKKKIKQTPPFGSITLQSPHYGDVKSNKNKMNTEDTEAWK